jgi:acetoin utilization protein AcuB
VLVKERMSRHPITTRPKTSLHDALQLMRDNKVRRLPVLDADGKLVGIVSEKDLLYASPSPATSLSVHEINYLIAKVTVDQLMAREVITVSEDCPLEEAARTMVDNDIHGLPVMRGDRLVGIVTESDLFKTFLEVLGARAWGLRVTLKLQEGKGVLARLTNALSAEGAYIVSLGTFWGDDPTNAEVAFKVQGIDEDTMRAIIESLDAELVDMRQTEG